MIHRYGPLSPVGVLTGRLSANCIMDDYLSPTSEHPVQNKVIYSALDGKVDKVSGKGLSTNDFTTEYMQKLDSIETGANKTVVDVLFISGSTNPVQSKTIQAALNAKADAADVTEALANKVDKVYGKVLSSNDFTDVEKAKLANIAAGADKTVVDDTLKSDSVNPVQNRVIHNALALKVDKISGKGLSTNDFTDELKNKLENLTPGGGAVNDVTLDGESVVDDDGVAVLESPEIHNAPSGGTLGQYLKKLSDDDYDFGWDDPPVVDDPVIFLSGTRNTSTNVVTVASMPDTARNLAMAAAFKVVVLEVGSRRYYPEDLTGNLLHGPFYFTFSALDNYVTTEVISFPGISPAATSMTGQLMTATIPTSKSDLGLGNVDNTSDLSKPISTATQTALDSKVDAVSGKGLSTNDYTTTEKNKLAGIAAEANKTTVDDALSANSANPVQNSVVTNELNTKANKVTEVTVATGGAVTQALEPGKIYHFTGSLTALTLAFATFITAHPVDCVAPAGGTATFSVAAIGDGLTYLWQGLENGQWTDTTFTTSRTNTLSMKATAARDGRQYRCVVTDQNGNQVISRPATMIIGSPESGGANTASPMLVQYHFDFTTGATAPTLTLPDSVIMPDGFSVEANKRYEVDILNNYGAVMAWAIS